MKKNYIESVLTLLKAGTPVETVLRGLKETLTRKGHLVLHKQILVAVHRTLSAKQATSAPVVTVADKSALASQKEAIATALEALQTKEEYVTKVDSTIIGGVIVAHDHKQIDQSYKSQLVKLYRTITN